MLANIQEILSAALCIISFQCISRVLQNLNCLAVRQRFLKPCSWKNWLFTTARKRLYPLLRPLLFCFGYLKCMAKVKGCLFKEKSPSLCIICTINHRWNTFIVPSQACFSVLPLLWRPGQWNLLTSDPLPVVWLQRWQDLFAFSVSLPHLALGTLILAHWASALETHLHASFIACEKL